MAYDPELDDDREDPDMPAGYNGDDEEEEDDDELNAEPDDDEEWQ